MPEKTGRKKMFTGIWPNARMAKSRASGPARFGSLELVSAILTV
jgi:hypothetical protein